MMYNNFSFSSKHETGESDGIIHLDDLRAQKAPHMDKYTLASGVVAVQPRPRLLIVEILPNKLTTIDEVFSTSHVGRII